MFPVITSAITALGSVFGAIFQTKQARLEAYATGISKVVDLLKAANRTDAEIAQAIAAAVTAEAQSESWFARSWRPLVMLTIASMVGAFVFGYVPPNIGADMPPLMEKCFELLTYGLCGYMPARSLEKIVKTVMTPKVVDTIMSKLGK